MPRDAPTRYALQHVLAEHEREAVRSFGDKVEKLSNVPVAGQDAKRTLLTVENHFDWTGAARGEVPLFLGQAVATPTDDELAAMHMGFRFFILKKERTHFSRIRKIVDKAFHKAQADDPGDVRSAGAAWKLPLLASIGCPVAGDDLLDLWFNGELFHDNEAKRARLDALRVQVGEDKVRAWLVLAFGLALAVLIAFHMFVRDRTDLYEAPPPALP